MKENIYDNDIFYEKYSKFPRSVKGLSAAGEWHELKRMLPNFNNKRVLDLGCGFGWHCIYAAEHGAKSVVGVDISTKMLNEAKKKTNHPNVTYICTATEDFNYQKESFDIVISSLSFHYISSFSDICEKVNMCLVPNGDFIFSVEHPIFTAEGKQDWIYDNDDKPLYWPVNDYFNEGKRNANFLGENVLKYHKTMTTYIQCLLDSKFVITNFCEPRPSEDILNENESMKYELLRPMMLIISAKKST